MVDFMTKRKSQLKISSIGDLVRQGKIKNGVTSVDTSQFIYGPHYVDKCVRKWSKKDILGIIGGAGSGKTTFVLNSFFHILKNNPDNDGVVVFVSLEMTAQEVATKWFKLVQDYPEFSDRLYIIENYDENGICKTLTTRDISNELTKIKTTLGVDILSFCIDHLHEINIESGLNDYNPTMKELKNIAVELDSLGMVLSQTTKGKAGVGDIPIDKSGSFGCSKFEWISTYVMSISQPLIRVQKHCDMPVLAFQYGKIRYKNKLDKVKESMNYLLMYDFETEQLRELNNAEKSEFAIWLEQCIELREAEEKYKSYAYDTSKVIKGKDGKEVVLSSTVGGETPSKYLED